MFVFCRMAEYAGVGWDRLMHTYQGQHWSEDNVDSELFTFLVQLRKMLEKSVNFWHKKYLEQYLLEDLDPFGLRVSNIPTIGHLN